MQNKHTDNKTDDRSKPRAHVERRTALDKVPPQTPSPKTPRRM